MVAQFLPIILGAAQSISGDGKEKTSANNPTINETNLRPDPNQTASAIGGDPSEAIQIAAGQGGFDQQRTLNLGQAQANLLDAQRIRAVNEGQLSQRLFNADVNRSAVQDLIAALFNSGFAGLNAGGVQPNLPSGESLPLPAAAAPAPIIIALPQDFFGVGNPGQQDTEKKPRNPSIGEGRR